MIKPYRFLPSETKKEVLEDVREYRGRVPLRLIAMKWNITYSYLRRIMREAEKDRS